MQHSFFKQSSAPAHQRLLIFYVVLFILFHAAMGPMVEVVEGPGLIRATVSHPARVTASRATGATTKAPTTALAPTTREDTAAMAKTSQVETDRLKKYHTCHIVHSNLMSHL